MKNVLLTMLFIVGAAAATPAAATSDAATSRLKQPSPFIQLAATTCTLGGRSYAVGSIVCRAHEKHECNRRGEWTNLRQKC
jgi:hypothetical protein